MSGTDLPDRVARVEASVAGLSSEVAGIRDDISQFGAQLSEVVKVVTSTDARTAERATAVKSELRDEGERKAREKGELFKNGLALVGTMSIVVAAIGGPYLNKLNATSAGQEQNTKDLSAVRELIASDHAEMMRNRDSIDVSREKNRWQDEHLFNLSQRQAFDEGVARREPPPR